MIIEYRDNETQRICESETYARRKFSPNVVTRLGMILYQLSAYDKFDVFRNNPANKRYRIHQLKGQESHLTSISLDYSARMTLVLEVMPSEDKVLIWEVSNHYGD